MLDPAQIGKPTLPKPLAGLSQNQTNGPEPTTPPSHVARQESNPAPTPRSLLATHHPSLRFLIASEQNIRIQCKPLKTKNGDPC
jgi:hypothetical protein